MNADSVNPISNGNGDAIIKSISDVESDLVCKVRIPTATTTRTDSIENDANTTKDGESNGASNIIITEKLSNKNPDAKCSTSNGEENSSKQVTTPLMEPEDHSKEKRRLPSRTMSSDEIGISFKEEEEEEQRPALPKRTRSFDDARQRPRSHLRRGRREGFSKSRSSLEEMVDKPDNIPRRPKTKIHAKSEPEGSTHRVSAASRQSNTSSSSRRNSNCSNTRKRESGRKRESITPMPDPSSLSRTSDKIININDDKNNNCADMECNTTDNNLIVTENTPTNNNSVVKDDNIDENQEMICKYVNTDDKSISNKGLGNEYDNNSHDVHDFVFAPVGRRGSLFDSVDHSLFDSRMSGDSGISDSLFDESRRASSNNKNNKRNTLQEEQTRLPYFVISVQEEDDQVSEFELDSAAFPEDNDNSGTDSGTRMSVSSTTSNDARVESQTKENNITEKERKNGQQLHTDKTTKLHQWMVQKRFCCAIMLLTLVGIILVPLIIKLELDGKLQK